MTTIRRFCCNDLLRFTSVNLDHLTETVGSSLFLEFESNFVRCLLHDLMHKLLKKINLLRIGIFAVQHVVLHDLFGTVAGLFPRCRSSWEPSHGLQ